VRSKIDRQLRKLPFIQKGLIPLMIERPEEDPAISVSVPSQRKPSARDLHIQRVGPPRLSELTAFADVIGSAAVLMVGPMPIAPGAAGAETIAMLCGLAEMAPRSYLSLTPHPTLIAHTDFTRVARKYRYIQENADEASLHDPTTNNLAAFANRLLALLGRTTSSRSPTATRSIASGPMDSGGRLCRPQSRRRAMSAPAMSSAWPG
jgi:hypothetical protein